ncbi:MAG: nuclear transport factor 2 family protein [Halothece sp.]
MSTAFLTPELSIEGLDLPLVETYFQRLNAQDFQGVAQLFVSNGELHPPLEEPVIGSSAIAQYLQTEATGMKLFPQKGNEKLLEDGTTEVYLKGCVKTTLFNVNVAWQFLLNTEQDKLLAVAVKLLASWEELAQIQR